MPADGELRKLPEQWISAGHHDLIDPGIDGQCREGPRRERLVLAALIHRGHAAHVEPEVGRTDRHSVSHQRRCDDEEHERDRDLAADEDAPEDGAPDGRARLASQRVRERQPRGLQRGQQCEQKRGARRGDESEDEHTEVEVERGDPHERRHGARKHAKEQRRSGAEHGGSQRKAGGPCEDRNEETLGQQLAYHATAARAERQTDPDLAVAGVSRARA